MSADLRLCAVAWSTAACARCTILMFPERSTSVSSVTNSTNALACSGFRSTDQLELGEDIAAGFVCNCSPIGGDSYVVDSCASHPVCCAMLLIPNADRSAELGRSRCAPRVVRVACCLCLLLAPGAALRGRRLSRPCVTTTLSSHPGRSRTIRGGGARVGSCASKLVTGFS